MPVLLKADIPQEAAFPVGGSATSSVAWDYLIADPASFATLGVICQSPLFVTRPGMVPSLAVALRVPVGKPGLKVQVKYVFLDLAGATVASGALASVTATSAATASTLTLPTAPDAARRWRVELWLDEGASGVTFRTNLFVNPRFAGPTSYFVGGYAVTTTNGTNAVNTGLPSTIATCAVGTVFTGVSAVNAGPHFFQNPEVASPVNHATYGYGMPVTPGDTITVSGYMKASKAGNVMASVRFITAAGAWVAAVTNGTAVAGSTTAWSRVSVTATVPAGAAFMGVRFVVSSTLTYAVGDTINVTGILIEKTALDAWFDGAYSPTGGQSPEWNGAADASSSVLVGAGETRNRHLLLAGTTVQAQAAPDEIIAAALNRPLRRSVYDALNVAAPQIAVGTPGLLAGSLTYLCGSLEDALALDGVYQYAGTVTLSTGAGEALDGFAHMAVETTRLTAERALPGKPSKWLVQAEVREIRE